MNDIFEENGCEYCCYDIASYIDHTFGEYRQEFEPFDDGILTIPLGVLGTFNISNYIQLVKDNDDNEKAYLVTYVSNDGARVGDPFEIDGSDWKRIEIKHCPFCGRKLV